MNQAAETAYDFEDSEEYSDSNSISSESDESISLDFARNWFLLNDGNFRRPLLELPFTGKPSKKVKSTERLSRYLKGFHKKINGNLLGAIKDLKRRIECDEVALLKEMINEEDMTLFHNCISDLSALFEYQSDFRYRMSEIECFMYHRDKLRRKLLSSANNTNFYGFMFSTVRLLGCALAIFNLLNFDGCLFKYFKISAFLKFSFLKSYFRPYNFLILSIVEYLLLKYSVNHIIYLLEEDRRFCKRANSIKKEMQSIISQLFPEEIDEKVISYIAEDALKVVFSPLEDKIFAAVLMSNFNHFVNNIFDEWNVNQYRDQAKFLYQILLFCKTDEAQMWYRSMVFLVYPRRIIRSDGSSVTLIRNFEVLKNELFNLKVTSCTLNQPLEDIVFCVAPLNLSRYVLFGLYSLCFFNSIRKFQYAKRCGLSNELRDIASHCYSDKILNQ